MSNLATKSEFSEVVSLIKKSRFTALQAVNSELMNLYWQIGEYISSRVESEGWGKAVVSQLAEYLKINEPELKGFSDKNLWRMKHLQRRAKTLATGERNQLDEQSHHFEPR